MLAFPDAAAGGARTSPARTRTRTANLGRRDPMTPLLSDRGALALSGGLGLPRGGGESTSQTALGSKFAPTMGAVLCARRRPRRWPEHLAGDKGYSFPGVRRWLRRRRIGPVIPTRSNQPREPDFDKKRYRRRNVIERVVGWYKERRALGTRYDKLAVNYLALWYVAIIENLLRRRLSDTT